MNSFYFNGVLPASKSIMNRLLIAKCYEPRLAIQGESDCEDVIDMKNSIPKVQRGDGVLVECGAAGTTFRFLSLLASRTEGQHRLSGTTRLMARPHRALVSILEQFGVIVTLSEHVLDIESKGWNRPSRPVCIDRSQSSQFATAVLLNSWNLPFDLEIEFPDLAIGQNSLSEGYFDMTVELMRALGMKLEVFSGGLFVPRESRIAARAIRAEIDISSAFAIAALGAVGGGAVFQEFPQKTLQPDGVFPQILNEMGVEIRHETNLLRVLKSEVLRPVEWSLGDCPDLFPVLSVLCAFADGRSRLFGAPHLAYKESSRILTTAKLVESLGREVNVLSDGLVIHGRRDRNFKNVKRFSFDPVNDHRLAMAAAVGKLAGADIEILDPTVVNKSFPSFWDIFSMGGRLCGSEFNG